MLAPASKPIAAVISSESAIPDDDSQYDHKLSISDARMAQFEDPILVRFRSPFG
jgi:hypothetical protein